MHLHFMKSNDISYPKKAFISKALYKNDLILPCTNSRVPLSAGRTRVGMTN